MNSKNQDIINRVLFKIEKELDYINLDEIIEFSGFSYYHFHRLFCTYVGESIKSYIIRLRLQRASHDIKYKSKSITDISQEANYSSPSAFNKAFKEFFGVSPRQFKKIELRQKEYSMIEPIRVEDVKDIDVYSIRHIGDYNKIGSAFEKLMKWAYTNKIKNKKNLMGKDTYSYGIAYDDPNVIDIDKLRSDACISATDDVDMEDGIYRQSIKGGKCAVFLHVGEYSKLKDTYNSIFSYYIKIEDARLRDVPIFEKYLNKDPRRTKPQNLKTEIYIPIV